MGRLLGKLLSCIGLNPSFPTIHSPLPSVNQALNSNYLKLRHTQIKRRRNKAKFFRKLNHQITAIKPTSLFRKIEASSLVPHGIAVDSTQHYKVARLLASVFPFTSVYTRSKLVSGYGEYIKLKRYSSNLDPAVRLSAISRGLTPLPLGSAISELALVAQRPTVHPRRVHSTTPYPYTSLIKRYSRFTQSFSMENLMI